VADPQNQDRDTVAIRAFNAFAQQEARVELRLVPIADGLMLCRKR
jgi:caffeoyl-CoA O-methyltransferase